MFGLGSKNIGIDLGTANTLVYIEGNQPRSRGLGDVYKRQSWFRSQRDDW